MSKSPINPIVSEEKDIQHKMVYGDINDLAKQMAQEVILALTETIEDLNPNRHEFRSALESTASRVMHHIDKTSERVGIYEEALPGFTLMVIKKKDGAIEKSTKQSTVSDSSSEAYEAAGLLIEQFMKRTNQTILSIEHESVLLVLFPVADTRKHLKALGFTL